MNFTSEMTSDDDLCVEPGPERARRLLFLGEGARRGTEGKLPASSRLKYCNTNNDLLKVKIEISDKSR